MARKAGVVGLGLIGGSVGSALRAAGWHVVGEDLDAATCERALELGAVDEIGDMAGLEVVFVATPVAGVIESVRRALDAGARTVTDVASVKTTIAEQIDDPRFVPGHPMAGSEQEGIAGSRADLFRGAVWVLTPTPATDDASFAEVRAAVSSTGADVVVVEPRAHDELVAVVSHVPHVAAGTLMRVAETHSREHRALLRLAAGGFRDMTRIAAGNPGIWPDILVDNQGAVTRVLDEVIASLAETRDLISAGDRAALLGRLEEARAARVNLPTGVPKDIDLAVVRVPVLDRPGELASITRLATEIDVNIYDLEIAHSSEGRRGVVIMVVPAATGERLVGALMAHDYRPSLSLME
jgi:prephenate dehydrogenase